MNISFNVPDQISGSLISASLWQIPDHPGWTYDRRINKMLKVYIGNIIDQHKSYMVLNVSQSALDDVKTQLRTLQQQEFQTQTSIYKLKAEVIPTLTVTDVGPD